MEKYKIVRYIYLYLVTAITIILLIVSTIGVINLGLKEYVFGIKGWGEFEDIYYECGEEYPHLSKPAIPEEEDFARVSLSSEEKEECIQKIKERRSLQHKNDLKRDFVNYLAMLIVALPLYLYHWKLINKKTEE